MKMLSVVLFSVIFDELSSLSFPASSFSLPLQNRSLLVDSAHNVASGSSKNNSPYSSEYEDKS